MEKLNTMCLSSQSMQIFLDIIQYKTLFMHTQLSLIREDGIHKTSALNDQFLKNACYF